MQWSELVREHGPAVYRTAWRVLGHVQDCEDVVQNVFIEAYDLFVAGEVTHWSTFLHRLATFRAIDALRRRKSGEAVDCGELIAVEATPEQALEARELEERVRQIVAELPERQAAVFCLTHFEQKSQQETAELLGVSANAVSLALHKARTALRTKLKQQNGGLSHD